MNYRYGGRSKTLAIGVFPEVTLKAARQQRDMARDLLDQGKDPSLEKQKARILKCTSAQTTFRAIATEWLDDLEKNSSVKHFKRTKRLLEGDIFSVVGDIGSRGGG